MHINAYLHVHACMQTQTFILTLFYVNILTDRQTYWSNEHVIDIMTKRFEQRVRNKAFLRISMSAFSQTDRLVRLT